MCDNCWDLDRREYALKMEGCDGNLTPFLTEKELKHRLEKKWVESHVAESSVISDAVINPKADCIEWDFYPDNGQKVTLRANLV